MDAIELLTQRRSCAALKAPAPEGEALETILQGRAARSRFSEVAALTSLSWRKTRASIGWARF